MALKSNHTDQMAKRLEQDLKLLAPELSIKLKADGLIEIKKAAAVLALAKLKRMSFDGFNIVAELSGSAGEGFPEHQAWLVIKNDATLGEIAKLVKAVAAAGAAELKVVESAAPAEADMVEANATSIPNDARLGAVGQ
jgi:hypothetical protein